MNDLLGSRPVKWILGVGCILLISLACQPKTQSETEAPAESQTPVATLATTTCPLGDSLVIVLARPASQLTVQLAGQLVPVTQRVPGQVSIIAALSKVGLYPLVVQGVDASNGTFSDTLQVEIRSDIMPTDRAYVVLETFPHRVASFTQGLEFHRGNLYEGTGLEGQSRLMRINLKTGQPLDSVLVPEQHFGEGITIVGNTIYQLTWTSGLCFRYNLDFSPQQPLVYHTQGWGLTHRDSTLIVSDGSNRLYFYTAAFQRTGELSVYDDKGRVLNLNELEYVNGYVFANIWQTNRIAQIELATGRVVAYLNLERILPPGIDTKENVLNGIAYESTENSFYLTGKNWPTLTKIRVEGISRAKINQ